MVGAMADGVRGRILHGKGLPPFFGEASVGDKSAANRHTAH